MAKSDFQVDELSIAEEWLRQSHLVKHYADIQAACQREYDRSKAAVDVAKADGAKEIRKEPERFGIDKLSEKAIEAALPAHPKVKAAVEAVIEARYALDVAKGAINALDHKRTAMSNVTELIHLGLYSAPIDKPARRKNREGEDLRARGLRDRDRKRSNQ